MSKGIHLDISIPTDWTRIELVRKAVGFCVWAVYGRGDLRDSLSMVSAELLENAMKYAPPDTSVRFTMSQEADLLTVAVTNSVEARSRHIAALTERLAWIDRYPTPAEAYMAALAEVFEHKEGQNEGGLGMVRIAYEGGCALTCSAQEPGMVTVKASRTVPQETSIA